MPLETCQMLAIVCSDKWGHGFGTLPKAQTVHRMTEKGSFRNHPCTISANSFVNNWRWLLASRSLCNEYGLRYGKPHTCFNTLSKRDPSLLTHKVEVVNIQHPLFLLVLMSSSLMIRLTSTQSTRCISHPNLG